MAMMAMTTNSSINVKALPQFLFPVFIFYLSAVLFPATPSHLN
jgi:hypothetical protein